MALSSRAARRQGLRRLSAAVANPVFVFFLGNAIVVALFAKSDHITRSSGATNAESEIHEELSSNIAADLQASPEKAIVFQDKKIICEEVAKLKAPEEDATENQNPRVSDSEPRLIDEPPFESEEEIGSAYEELYGPAYSGESYMGKDVYVMDSKVKKSSGFRTRKEKTRDGFDERVIQVRRVTKVVKRGKQMRFRAIVVVGDKKGQVDVGHGKAKEIIEAVQKAATDARRNIITIPLTKYSTFPHRFMSF